VNATLPKDLDPQDVTLERAVELIAEKQAKGGKGKRAGGGAKKEEGELGRRADFHGSANGLPMLPATQGCA
jgi:topoisomerase IA-like protein